MTVYIVHNSTDGIIHGVFQNRKDAEEHIQGDHWPEDLILVESEVIE